MQQQNTSSEELLRLALPKGRMERNVLNLLAEAGIEVRAGERSYRAALSLEGWEVKLLKPQNIIEMLAQGSRDLGFAGNDWVEELEAELVPLLPTGLDPVRVVAASSREQASLEYWRNRSCIVVSELTNLARRWIERHKLQGQVLRSFGATEVFPPEDGDIIIDVTATGSTLAANGLVLFDEVTRSSTTLFASRRALDNVRKRRAIEDFVLLVRSVLEARERVMLELNVSAEKLDAVCQVLPCMKYPTIAKLHGLNGSGQNGSGEHGYAVKAAVLRSTLPQLIPQLKAQGGTDITVCKLSHVVS